MKKIVNEFGWPGIGQVGEEASHAAFLVLQHTSLSEQEELLPLFRKAVSEGNALSENLAILEDRVRIRKGQKQIYGSQVVTGSDGIPKLQPIEEPKTVDERRKSVGLPPIEEYLEIVKQYIGKKVDRSALESK